MLIISHHIYILVSFTRAMELKFFQKKKNNKWRILILIENFQSFVTQSKSCFLSQLVMTNYIYYSSVMGLFSIYFHFFFFYNFFIVWMKEKVLKSSQNFHFFIPNPNLRMKHFSIKILKFNVIPILKSYKYTFLILL